MSSIVFITDVHVKTSSRVRTGDVLTDIVRKLEFVVSYCNNTNSILLCGGDFFDRPTVPDVAKTKIISVLNKLKTPMYNIPGNHCELYGNPEYNYKTSFNLFEEAGLWKNLDKGDVVLDDVILTSQIPITTKGKPQIVVFHGLLNQDDGRCTFRFTDIKTDDNTFILLGHDHCVYDDLRYKSNIKIIRPGSLLRGERADEQNRIPQLVHIIVDNGVLKSKKVDIDCRDPKEVFTTKLFTISKSQKHDSYEAIISQIRDSRSNEMTFKEALCQVCEPDVSGFIFDVLSDYKLNSQFKNQNL